jgi:hypothetical protein
MKNKPSETYTSPFTEVNPYQRNIEPLVMRETLPIPFALKFKYALKISGLSILINLSVQISVCALILCLSPASLNLINSYFLTQMGLGLIPCLAIFTASFATLVLLLSLTYPSPKLIPLPVPESPASRLREDDSNSDFENSSTPQDQNTPRISL